MRLSTEALEEEAQGLLCEISSKFVGEPSPDEVANNLLISLKRYCYSVRARAREVEQNRDALKNPSLR